jgi:hypothetical protein
VSQMRRSQRAGRLWFHHAKRWRNVKTKLTLHFFAVSVFLAIIVILAAILTARAQLASAGPGVEFSAVRLAPGERARLIALNAVGAPSEERGSCGVTYRFLDTQLQVVKEAVAVLKAGEASELDLSRRDLPGNDSVEIHSMLLFGYSGGAPPNPRMLIERYDCNIRPSLEVYDPAGTLRLRLTDARPLPPPPGPQQ